jgi:uncharacterized phage protein (TIGR02218 family)
MKSANAALQVLFASGNQFLMADLFKFTLTNGTVLTYTTYDADIVANGYVYSSSGPMIERTKGKLSAGVEVDTITVDIWPSPSHMIGALSWTYAVATGALDGATVRIDRAFMSSSTVVAGTVNVFTGIVSEVQMTRSQIEIIVSSPLDLLNVQMPRNLYQAGCLHSLYDSGCTLSAAAYAVSGAITVAQTASLLQSGLSNITSWFDLGYVTFTSGANVGVTRTVKSYTNFGGYSQLNLITALPAAPAVGDTFTAYPGCNKMQLTCSSKFNNLTHFKGFPYVPIPETAL